MLKKITLILWLIWIGFSFSACSNSQSWSSVQWLPELFSVIPNDFDQLLMIDVDENVLELVATQYGETTPIAKEFEWIDTIVIRQKGSAQTWENLLFVQGDEVNINQLAALWIVALDPDYQSFELTENVQVYGEKALVDSKIYNGVKGDELLQEFWKLYTKSGGNFNFLSRPWGEWLQWLAIQFAAQLKWTVGSISIGNKLPTGEASMLFKDGVVPSRSDSWSARAWSPESPIHVATHGLTELLWLDKTLVKTFLPILLTQYLGDWAALFTDSHYDSLIQWLNGSVSLDVVPSLIGMWGRLVVEDPQVFSIFDSLYPVLDGAVKTKMFAWTEIESIKQASSLRRNTQVPIDWWENLALPLLSIDQTPETTSLSLLLVDELALNTSTQTYPGDTLAVAEVDFTLLTQLMWVEAGELLQGTTDTKLKLEMKSDSANNRIRILLD